MMDGRKMKRQAATPKGLMRRIHDAHFERARDPRVAGKVTYPLATMLVALVVGMVTRARSLRSVEERTAQIVQKHSTLAGVSNRIADNTFGRLLPRIQVNDLMARAHAAVKAEHRRGNLKPTVLPLGTVAIDGKNVATLRWHDLCRVLELEPDEASPEQVKSLLAERYPAVQFCRPKQGEPYALARVHTVTLISAEAAVGIHQRATLGHTNEIGSMPELLEELHDAYGRTDLFRMLTTDAGNTSLKVAGLIRGHHWDYFLQIKSGHGDLYAEAVRALRSLPTDEGERTVTDQQNGKTVTYHVWRHDLTDQGWLDWDHARLLVRVQRASEDPHTGEVTIGNRYYVSSRPPSELGPMACLQISRAHWRCENETHWSKDVVLQEDRRRLAWSRHPNGVFVASILRMIALNILAVARRLSRMDYSLETPTWRQIAEHFVLLLCGAILDTEAFDAEKA
jgi:DDE family transposase